MTRVDRLDDLLIKIEHLRNRMTEVALIEGFTSPESLRISQELDDLLNRYDCERKNNQLHKYADKTS
ncbi:aspartyl-phosphate phosphatase Spo0E family protein [Thalassobacillus sp. CUG 92003]|uniref:Spo0E family sporulation regulatory protein-aspartic acid phosphatase n=1 Tax=Thalassobacillus sp. CUG 92003 TaxID=2736641 RepID=UPI0015E77C4B